MYKKFVLFQLIGGQVAQVGIYLHMVIWQTIFKLTDSFNGSALALIVGDQTEAFVGKSTIRNTSAI